jgi:hypothetical protein
MLARGLAWNFLWGELPLCLSLGAILLGITKVVAPGSAALAQVAFYTSGVLLILPLFFIFVVLV